MIVWHLSRLMAERRVSGKQLAEILEVHPNTVSRLRRAFTMPPIDGDLLNKLCHALNCIPSDLIEHIPSEDEIAASKLSTVSEVNNEQDIAELSQNIASVIQATSSGKTSITSQDIFTAVAAVLAVRRPTKVNNEQDIAELSQNIASVIQATSSGKTSITSQDIFTAVAAVLAVRRPTNILK